MLDALFFDTPHTLRYGATENLYGYKAIRAFRAARPGKTLARTVTARVVTTCGDAFASRTSSSGAMAIRASAGRLKRA
jgi:hypothetical protein